LNEIKAYVGLLILFGLTDKSKISIHYIWSKNACHYAPFATAALLRERFQLISNNITFEDKTESILSRNKKQIPNFTKWKKFGKYLK
jgi:hypothetical protein